MDKLIDAKISIIMPAYNEEGVIGKSIEECKKSILKYFMQGEIIVIDDCSSDGTNVVLEQLSEDIPELIYTRNPINLGHGPSLMKALNRASGDYIFAIDSDYQHPLREFWKLFEARKGADIITGLRAKRQDGVHRLAISSIANFLTRTLFACPWQDLNIPYKLFSRHSLKQLLPFIPEKSFIPSILLMASAARAGLRVTQIEVTHLPRTTGKCSLPGRRLILFCIRATTELVVFRTTKWRQISPFFSPTP